MQREYVLARLAVMVLLHLAGADKAAVRVQDGLQGSPSCRRKSRSQRRRRPSGGRAAAPWRKTARAYRSFRQSSARTRPHRGSCRRAGYPTDILHTADKLRTEHQGVGLESSRQYLIRPPYSGNSSARRRRPFSVRRNRWAATPGSSSKRMATLFPRPSPRLMRRFAKRLAASSNSRQVISRR